MTNFRTGAKAAEEAAEKAKGGSFSSVDFFTIKKGEVPNNTKTVRFITDYDGWITVAQHASLPTRQAPEGYKGNWPSHMPGTCRFDEKDGERTFPQFSDCWGCHVYKDKDGKPAKKQDRTWGLGILRKEVWEDAKLIRIEDVMREVTFEKDGVSTVKTIPHYLVFSMAWSNFWAPIDGIASMKGTCLDRDWRIHRTGFDMNDTDYKIGPHDPLNVVMPDGTQRVLDFRDPEILAFYPDIPDLGEFITRRANDEYYHRFFDTRFQQPSQGKEEKSGAANQASTVAPPQTEVNQSDLAALSAHLMNKVSGGAAPQPMGYGPQAAPAAAEPVAAPVAAPAAVAPVGPQPVGLTPQSI